MIVKQEVFSGVCGVCGDTIGPFGTLDILKKELARLRWFYDEQSNSCLCNNQECIKAVPCDPIADNGDNKTGSVAVQCQEAINVPAPEGHIMACIYGKGEPGNQVCSYDENEARMCNQRMYLDKDCPLMDAWENVPKG